MNVRISLPCARRIDNGPEICSLTGRNPSLFRLRSWWVLSPLPHVPTLR